MAAGTRTWAVYNADDHGTRFGAPAMAMNIPSEFVVADNDFGWTAVADAGSSVDTADSRMSPRHVVGVSADGHRATAIVADIASNLWAGITSVWVDTKGTTFVVTGYVGEKRTRAR